MAEWGNVWRTHRQKHEDEHESQKSNRYPKRKRKPKIDNEKKMFSIQISSYLFKEFYEAFWLLLATIFASKVDLRGPSTSEAVHAPGRFLNGIDLPRVVRM